MIVGQSLSTLTHMNADRYLRVNYILRITLQLYWERWSKSPTVASCSLFDLLSGLKPHVESPILLTYWIILV